MKYEYKGYEVSAAYSKEDDCIVCKVINVKEPSAVIFDVQRMDQVEAEFHLVIDFYLMICEEKGVYPCPRQQSS